MRIFKMDLTKERKVVRFAAYAVFFQTAMGAIAVGQAITLDRQDDVGQLLNDPFNFIDTGILLICAWGLFKESRLFAVIVSAWALASFGLAGYLSPFGIALKTVIFALYLRATLGTFRLHKAKITNLSDKSSTSLWIKIPVGIVGLTFVGVLVLGFLVLSGVANPTDVQSGALLSKSDRGSLVQNGVIYDFEKIDMFYFTGFFSPLAEGVLLTDNGIVYFSQDTRNALQVSEILFSEMAEINLVTDGSWSLPAIYEVRSTNKNKWMRIPLSVEKNGDRRFIEMARKRIPSY